MTDTDTEELARRVAAVERAVTDGESGSPALAEAAEATERIDRLESRVEELEAAAAEREAAVRALRGYVGQTDAAEREVERTAESALATAEGLADRVEAMERRLESAEPRSGAGHDPNHPREAPPDPTHEADGDVDPPSATPEARRHATERPPDADPTRVTVAPARREDGHGGDGDGLLARLRTRLG